MAFKLDDFLSKKKEPTQVLDLSKVKITSKDEFKKYLDKIPEFKIKPEKVAPESIKLRDKDFSFTPGRREEKQMKDWSFPDPTPPDMRSVKLDDLCPVNIDWKMLTTLRPKTKVEEEMFSRLVQLGKLDLKHQQALRREKITDWVRKTKNPRSSIVEVRVLSCKECGEDLCDGFLCSKMTYDCFSRNQAGATAEDIKNFKIPEAGKSPKKKKRKQKRKSRKRARSKVKRMKPRKNSIFNRPATTGCSRDHSRRGSHAKAEKMRSISLNRIQSERKPNFLKIKRSKSAPFKRDASDPAFATRSEYASDSAPTQTDYSSQSDQESCQNRECSPESAKGKHSFRVGFADSYRSHARRKRSYSTHRSGSDAPDFDSRDSSTSRSTSKTPEASPSRTDGKYPTTIQIKFDGFHPSSSVFIPRKSYAPNKLGYTRRGESLTVPRNQEVTKIMEGFTRIDLSFMDDEQGKVDIPMVSPKRISSRLPRSRCRSNTEALPSYIKGKGLLAKYIDRKKS